MKLKTKPSLPKIKARFLPRSQLSHCQFRLTVALMGVAFSNEVASRGDSRIALTEVGSAVKQIFKYRMKKVGK